MVVGPLAAFKAASYVFLLLYLPARNFGESFALLGVDCFSRSSLFRGSVETLFILLVQPTTKQ